MRTILIGDIHGEFYLLKKFLKANKDFLARDDTIILVGDVGVGFGDGMDDQFIKLVQTSTPRIRFIRGNHDNPAVIKALPGYIPDGTIEDGVLFIGGAWSIDQSVRTPGLNWWAGEELDEDEWNVILADYKNELSTVHTVVSHDGPWKAVAAGVLDAPGQKLYHNTTNTMLNILWERYPNIRRWVFGHYHVRRSFTYNNVQFEVLPHRITDYLQL